MSVAGHLAETPAESARELQAEYVMCRTLRHAWHPFTDHTIPTPIRGKRVDCFCNRCGMRRHTLIVPGYQRRHTYEPPPNYKLSGEVTSDNLWEQYLVLAETGEIKTRKAPRKLAAV